MRSPRSVNYTVILTNVAGARAVASGALPMPGELIELGQDLVVRVDKVSMNAREAYGYLVNLTVPKK